MIFISTHFYESVSNLKDWYDFKFHPYFSLAKQDLYDFNFGPYILMSLNMIHMISTLTHISMESNRIHINDFNFVPYY